jgi:hypothetical protein
MNSKLNDYLLIKNLFYDYIKKNTPENIFKKINMCYETYQQEFIMELTEIIKIEKPHYTYKHLYIAVIFLYYSLVLSEQTEDFLYFSIIQNLTSNHVNVTKLIIEIVSSDEEYARTVRKAFFKLK